MKQYADKTNRAKEHNFDVGYYIIYIYYIGRPLLDIIVYIVSMENGKLPSSETHTMCYCDKPQANSFKVVSTENGSRKPAWFRDMVM